MTPLLIVIIHILTRVTAHLTLLHISRNFVEFILQLVLFQLIAHWVRSREGNSSLELISLAPQTLDHAHGPGIERVQAQL